MELQSILADVDIENRLPQQHLTLHIQGIADNSAHVKPNDLFVAISGYQTDGHRYIDDAIQKGAAAVIGEKPITDLPVPYIQVSNSREALGIAAKNFYNNPAKDKVIIGITGTNGKTTTSYLIKHLLESSGHSCALIGTIQTIINGETEESRNTTPNALALHRMLHESKDHIVIMEVSSHGLDQHRVSGMMFDYALFTNLAHDHLDYHHTMENYFQAKKKLFNYLREDGTAIVNTDDSWGEKLAKQLKKEGKHVYTIGQDKTCDAHLVQMNLKQSTITLRANEKTHSIFSPLAGTHNMYNTVLAYCTANQFGRNETDLKQYLHEFNGVEGRFETIKNKNGATIVIDYAHTSDALEHCLHTAKQSGAKKITNILGFRGDRDTEKRKHMLSVICEMSDEYILTFDDLNSVPPESMVHTLHELHQKHGNEKGKIITDRTLAIQKAIENSDEDHWIFITGKGHEKYEQKFRLQTESDKDTVLFLTNHQHHDYFKEI